MLASAARPRRIRQRYWIKDRPAPLTNHLPCRDERAMMVRCIDNFLQSEVLIDDHLYEVLGERDDCYVLSGLDKPMSKVRFEPVTPPKAIEALKAKGK